VSCGSWIHVKGGKEGSTFKVGFGTRYCEERVEKIILSGFGCTLEV
jgi:hypothetical protein